MARGKYLSLEEARKQRRLDRFCKEHPSEGEKETFERLLDATVTAECYLKKGSEEGWDAREDS